MNARAIECNQTAGVIKPMVDFNRCEGKGECVRVCPENVFAMARIENADYRKLGLASRFKLRVHGMQVAYTRTWRPAAPAVFVCRPAPRRRSRWLG